MVVAFLLFNGVMLEKLLPFWLHKLNITLVVSLLGFTSYSWAAFPEFTAKAYILIDHTTGEVLASHNPDMRLAPASLTKIMTSYIIADKIAKGELSSDECVKISKNAWGLKFPGGAQMFLEPGQKVTLRQLNQGLITVSGNDAAVAIAEHISGDIPTFATLMNQYVSQLGLKNTRFVNPHGLDAPEQYSSARDLALLCKALILLFPKQYHLYQQKSFTWNSITQQTRNRLLWDKVLDIDGIKTGYTSHAGYSLASSVVQDERRLIAILMGADSDISRFNESRRLLSILSDTKKQQ